MIALDLRALTVRQPHAWAIVAGHKTVENRGWAFPLPTPVTIAIHAGVRYDHDGLTVRVPGTPHRHQLVELGQWGAIIGLVDVVACHAYSVCTTAAGRGGVAVCSPWALWGSHHWVLANARMLPEPIQCRGRLTLWRPEPQVMARLRRHV